MIKEGQIKSLRKIAAVGVILFIFLSAVHTHMLPINMDWDGGNAMFIVGAISFILSCVMTPAPNPKRFLLRIILLPVLFSISFSFFELFGEFSPNVISKGWGIIYITLCYPSSLIGTVAGLTVGRLISNVQKIQGCGE